MKNVLIIVSLLVLSACGSGPESSSTAKTSGPHGVLAPLQPGDQKHLDVFLADGTPAIVKSVQVSQVDGQRLHKLFSMTASQCRSENGLPDMFPDITWSLCENSTYTLEIDNPDHTNPNFVAYLTRKNVNENGIVFQCHVTLPHSMSGVATGQVLLCDAIGRQGGMGHHTLIGVSN